MLIGWFAKIYYKNLLPTASKAGSEKDEDLLTGVINYFLLNLKI